MSLGFDPYREKVGQIECRSEAWRGEEAIISQFIPVARGSQRRTMPLSPFMRGRRERERAGARGIEGPSANTCSECVVWLG